MLIKIHHSYRDVVAVCDSELLGKVFEEGNFQLDVKESFFLGDKVSEKELIVILRDMGKEDATFNIVGDKAISCALKAGIIDKQGVGKIKGIPFALVLM